MTYRRHFYPADARDRSRRQIDESIDRLHRRRIAVWEGRRGQDGAPYPKRPTIGEVAGLVGVTPTTLYRYRMGQTMPARIVSALSSLARIETTTP